MQTTRLGCRGTDQIVGHLARSKGSCGGFRQSGRPLGSGSENWLKPFETESGAATQGLFSPDGRVLVVADEAGQVAFWNLAERRKRGVLTNAPGSLGVLRFSRDGRWLVNPGGKSPTQIWSVEDRTLVAELRDSAFADRAVFSADGRWLAIVGGDPTVRLWETSRWQKTRTFHGHTDPITAVDFSPNGHLLATGARNGEVKLWSLDEPPTAPEQVSFPASEFFQLAGDGSGFGRVSQIKVQRRRVVDRRGLDHHPSATDLHRNPARRPDQAAASSWLAAEAGFGWLRWEHPCGRSGCWTRNRRDQRAQGGGLPHGRLFGRFHPGDQRDVILGRRAGPHLATAAFGTDRRIAARSARAWCQTLGRWQIAGRLHRTGRRGRVGNPFDEGTADVARGRGSARQSGCALFHQTIAGWRPPPPMAVPFSGTSRRIAERCCRGP